MSGQAYQGRGLAARTMLITVRVSAEQRSELHRIAAGRGETLSRMLLSPWLGAVISTRSRRTAVGESSVSARARDVQTDACSDAYVEEQKVDWVVRVEPASGSVEFVGQGSLFGAIGGDR